MKEKELIYFCFQYSRTECWGRNKTQVFEQKIDSADLPPEKIRLTSIKKLQSIVSQIGRYIDPEKLKEIEVEAKTQATKDHGQLDDGAKQKLEIGTWKIEEKWCLIWSMRYATRRHQTQKNISQEWKTIFKHFFPGKAALPPNVLTSQRYNFIKSNVFSQEQIESMESSIEKLVEERLCPVSNPIPVPDIMMDRTQQPINDNSPKLCSLGHQGSKSVSESPQRRPTDLKECA